MVALDGNDQIGSDFNTDVFLGRKKGMEALGVTGTNEDITSTTVFTDVTDVGGVQAIPVVAEAVKIRSLSADDDFATGEGLKIAVYLGLDQNYNEEVPILVNMDGLNDVLIPGAHIAHHQALLGFAGTNFINQDDVIIETQGGSPVERLRMKKEKGNTFSSIRTIPAGKTGYVRLNSAAIDEGSNIKYRALLDLPGIGRITGQDFDLHQNHATQPLLAPFAIQEKTTFRVQAKRKLVGKTSMSVILETLLTLNAIYGN